MAWLNATPEKSEKSRRETYPEDSVYLEMIPLDEYESHLITLWHECGTVGTNGMGITSLDWPVINSWAERFYSEDVLTWVKSPTKRWMPIVTKQHTLLDYELQIIRQLSQEYASEYAAASEPMRACPKEIVVEEMTKDEVFANSMSMGSTLLEMFGKK